MELGIIQALDGSRIYVSVISDFDESGSVIPDLPDGAEPTGVSAYFQNSFEAIKKTIEDVTSATARAFETCSPSEWTMEIQIGLKGKVNPIPVLTSSEAESVLRISAKWKKA